MKSKRRIAIVLVLSVFISAIAILQSFPDNQVKISKAVSKSSDEAINWVKSQVGKGIDYDGAYGCQCVDLIKAYYNYLGVNPANGNGADYRSNALPAGWGRIQGAQPQKGDILVYTGGYNGYGHVAIYESDRSHYHQNFDSHSYVERITYMYNGLSTPYWGVIRPNWNSGNNPNACLDECYDMGGKIRVRGWAFDRDNLNTSIDVHIYIGDEGHAIKAYRDSPDVSNVFGITGKHRFDEVITTNKRGVQTVYFHAINIGGGSNVMWDKRDITISNPKPVTTPTPTKSPTTSVSPSPSPKASISPTPTLTPTTSPTPTPTPTATPVGRYTISYVLNGGTNNYSNPTSYSSGDYIVLKNPKKAGYKFLGWYKNGHQEPYISIFDKEDIVFTAKWEKIEIENVYYYAWAYNKKPKTIVIKVSGTTDFDDFQIKIIKGTKNKSGSLKTISSEKNKTLKFTKLKKGVKYSVWIRARIKDSTGTYIYGKWSRSATVKVKK